METKELKEKLKEIEDWFLADLSQISTGRANPSLLDSIKVDVYGSLQPIKSVASITLEDPKTLRVSPWEKSQIKIIEQAVHVAKLPLSVATDEQGLRIQVPALTEESRQGLVKMVKEKLEQARVKVRNSREEAIKLLSSGDFSEDEVRASKTSIQDIINEANDKLQKIFEKKEADITTV